jgi:hypothetical protein
MFNYEVKIKNKSEECEKNKNRNTAEDIGKILDVLSGNSSTSSVSLKEQTKKNTVYAVCTAMNPEQFYKGMAWMFPDSKYSIEKKELLQKT